MARPREFDESVVLGQAMKTFWQKGFEGTSLADLCAATGLAKGSLYQAFGDKRRLYLRALRAYIDDGQVTLAQNLARAPTARQGLAEWLERMAHGASQSARKGCFVVNAGVEMGPHDPEVRDLLADHNRRWTRTLAECVARGMSEGDFRQELCPEEGARFLAVFSHGLQAVGRRGFDPKHTQHLVRDALKALA